MEDMTEQNPSPVLRDLRRRAEAHRGWSESFRNAEGKPNASEAAEADFYVVVIAELLAKDAEIEKLKADVEVCMDALDRLASGHTLG
ncbi:MAG: hypothetical protein AAF235_07275, partial [Planctomycetota bacterium]